jgi:hypothetical protein
MGAGPPGMQPMDLEPLALGWARDSAREAANDYDGHWSDSQRDDLEQELLLAATKAAKKYNAKRDNAATRADWQIKAMRNRLRGLLRDDGRRNQTSFERDLASEAGAPLDYGANFHNRRAEAVLAAYAAQVDQYAADPRLDEHQSESRTCMIGKHNATIHNVPGTYPQRHEVYMGERPS